LPNSFAALPLSLFLSSTVILSPAFGATYAVPNEASDTEAKSLGGTDHLTVEEGGSLSVDGTAVKWQSPSTGIVIDNAGLIESTDSGGRAINASGNATQPRTLTLNNAAGAVIRSESDAFRINTDITGGTVTINNAGLIHSTIDGQALDFDAVESAGTGTARIVINNAAGGTIQADGADAIRPGQGAVVNNAGLIYSDGVIGDKNDGVDWQAHSGTVHNLAGGVISGQRHGITSDTDVDVVNDARGTIIGRNGSGVGSDGTGRVINHGMISGDYVGTGSGDGDGVDIDARGYVENYGVIQGTGAGGVGSDGYANEAEGVAITGGATIINHAGASISGVTRGITITGGGYVENEGTIRGGDAAVLVDGPGDGYVVNAGIIQGDYWAILMHTANSTLVIQRGSQISGIVEAGTGNNKIFLEDGSVFDSAVGFQSLQVDGAATLTGDSVIASTYITPGSSLRFGQGGTSGSVSGAIVDDGTMIVDRSDEYGLPAAISGSGKLIQAGPGTTVVADAQAYTGGTIIENGMLAVRADGTLAPGELRVNGGTLSLEGGSLAASDVIVEHGLFRGGGALASLTVGNGTVAPDSPLQASGDIVLEAGSTYVVDPGGSGTITTTGHAALNGGTLQIVASDQPILGTHEVIAADGGIDGRFGALQLDYPLLQGDLEYAANTVNVAIAVNKDALAAAAASPNGSAAALALTDLPISSALLNQVATLPAAAVPGTLQALSGEQHASMRSAIIEDALRLPQKLIGGLSQRAARDRAQLWLTADASDRRLDGSGSLGRVGGSTWSVAGGAEVSSGIARLGAMIDYHHGTASFARPDGDGRFSGYSVAAYGEVGRIGPLARMGLAYTRWNTRLSRTVSAGSIDDRLRSDGHASSYQAFGEVAYAAPVARTRLEPFASLSWLRLGSSSWRETGGEGALDGAAKSAQAVLGSLGTRASFDARLKGFDIRPHAELAGDRLLHRPAIRQSVRFDSSASRSRYLVAGLPLARMRGRLDVGATLQKRTLFLDLAYRRTWSAGIHESGVRASLGRSL
jgi:autotransporter-associated beta strand protein